MVVEIITPLRLDVVWGAVYDVGVGLDMPLPLLAY